MATREWILKRNCSLGPWRTACAYAAPCLLAVAVGVVCAVHGAWPVLAFGLLQCGALALAFFCYAGRAADYQRIVLNLDELLVETVEFGKRRRQCFQPYWVRIVMPGREWQWFCLESKGCCIVVGRFACPDLIEPVAAELRQALLELKSVPGQARPGQN
jgi:uncharacterized membrane protein